MRQCKWGLMGIAVVMLSMSAGCKTKTEKSIKESYSVDQSLQEENTRLRGDVENWKQQVAAKDALLMQRQQDAEDWHNRYNQSQQQLMSQASDMSRNTAPTGNSSELSALQGRIKELEGTLAKSDKDGNLVIVLDTQVFFKAGSADLNKKSQQSLLDVARILNENYSGNKISVDGHCDSDPIKKSASQFKTNWELASSSSLEVLHFLNEEGKVKEDRLTSRSYSYFAPVAANDSNANKSKNRRVEIVILKNR